MSRRLTINRRRPQPIRHQQRHVPVFDDLPQQDHKGWKMKKIMLIMVVIMIGVPVLRSTMVTNLDGNGKSDGFSLAFLKNSGGAFSSVVGLITTKFMNQDTRTPPVGGTGSVSGQPRPAETRGAETRDARAPGGTATGNGTGLARGADGILTPEIMRLLNPTSLTGQNPGQTPDPATAGRPATSSARPPGNQGAAEQAKVNQVPPPVQVWAPGR